MGQIIAPRADGEGSLGTVALHWGDVRTDKINGATIPSDAAATTSAAGLVELATEAEVQAGEDAARAVTSAGLKAYTEWRPSGMKNLLINGNFDIWQSGNGPFLTPSGAAIVFLADRWGGVF